MNKPATLPTSLAPSRWGRSGDDPIFALDREARERRSRGESVVNATLGALLDDAGQLAILPTASQALREVSPLDWAAYAPIEGLAPFLHAVIEDVFGPWPALAAQCTAVATPGGSGALRHAIATFLEPGQSLLTTSFHWGPYKTLAEENERRIDTFRMLDAAGGLDLAALDGALARHVASQGRVLLVLNDPCHNPCGYSMNAADWAGVVDVVRRHAGATPTTIVLDNAYAAYGPPGSMATALTALARLAEEAQVLVAWSASKTFTHYGLRVGALVALVPDAERRKDIYAALAYACRGTWSNCNRGGMTAVARLLATPTLRSAVDREREAFIALLGERVAAFNSAAQAAGLVYPRYAGGFFTTVETANAQAVAARMRTRGVFVVPVPGGLRIGICAVRAADVPRTVQTLRECQQT